MEPEEIDDHLTSGYWQIEPERPKTRRACAAVLARLPEEIADRIIYSHEVLLFAPGGSLGQCLPYSLYGQMIPKQMNVVVNGSPQSHSYEMPHFKFCLVYLAEELEKEEYPVIVAVVAHEVAHGILREVFGDECERQADLQIIEWGFEAELQALRDANPHHRY